MTITTATATAPRPLADAQVGDILVSVWGYSMTIVDYYEVTARKGATILALRKLAKRQLDGDPGWHGRVEPLPGEYVGGEAILARITRKRPGQVKLPEFSSGVYAEPWDGRPRYFNSAD